MAISFRWKGGSQISLRINSAGSHWIVVTRESTDYQPVCVMLMLTSLHLALLRLLFLFVWVSINNCWFTINGTPGYSVPHTNQSRTSISQWFWGFESVRGITGMKVYLLESVTHVSYVSSNNKHAFIIFIINRTRFVWFKTWLLVSTRYGNSTSAQLITRS